MTYSVCVIDDKIPAGQVQAMNDSEPLNASNLKMLLADGTITWEDAAIKSLIVALLAPAAGADAPQWQVSGLTHPALFVNALNDGIIRSDIIVFDWEYPGTGFGGGGDPEVSLLEILEKTFCLVFIYSGADKEAQIHTVMEKAEFREHRNRLEYLDKTSNGVEQTAALIAKAQSMFADNFSFHFASSLRKGAAQIMDRTLSEIGKATLANMKNYLKLEESSGKRELVDFVAERFRSGLVGYDLPSIPVAAPQPTGPLSAGDQDLVKRIWAFRLYVPLDPTLAIGEEIVRRGDIVKVGGDMYLVISADCDLRRFWHKNFGALNLLPLHSLHTSNSRLCELLTLCVDASKLKTGEHRHLTEKIGALSEGPFILPFLNKTASGYESFVLFPKELTSQHIGTPAELSGPGDKSRLRESHLKYSWWAGSAKVCTIAEPYLTAVIQHVFDVMGGYGTPDYPHPAMKEIFKGILNDVFPPPPVV